MALYVGITLLAAIGLVHDPSQELLALVWGTSLGLAVAHFVAFEVAARLADPDHDRHHVGRLAAAQGAGAVGVAVVVTVAVLVVPSDATASVAWWATAATIAAVVLVYGRAWGRSWARAAAGAAAVVVLAAVAAAVKTALGH